VNEVTAMAKAWKYDLRCGCGRFVKPDADSGTPWGTYTDIDEPEPEYYCDECVKKCIERCVRRGYVPNAWYRPPKWTAIVAQRLCKS